MILTTLILPGLLFLLISSNVYSAGLSSSPNGAYLGDFIVVKQINGSVLVKWSTISEHNNDFFSIEYSSDGLHYSSIGKVTSLGNTADGFKYQFIDFKPQTGRNFYQLKMVEISGKGKLSEVRTVMINSSEHFISVFPNPSVGRVSLQLDAKEGEELKVAIYDVAGRKAAERSCFIKNQKTELNLDELNTGMYAIVAFTSIGMQFKSKLIIAR